MTEQTIAEFTRRNATTATATDTAARRVLAAHDAYQALTDTTPDDWDIGYVSGLETALEYLMAHHHTHTDWQPEWSPLTMATT